MRRLPFLALAVFALLAAACGGDDGDSNGDGGAAQAHGSPTATPTPKLLPTPPKAPTRSPPWRSCCSAS